MKRVELKIEALTRAGIWPSNDPGKIKPKPWLNNFDEGERDIAAALIDIFVNFPEQQVVQILERALRRLLQDFGGNEQLLNARRDRIRYRLERTLFVPVEGETPNPTDSGNFICRLARQTLELSESQVQKPADALQQYLNDKKTIVFLDDMVGTGNQMHETWIREYGTHHPKSFQEAYSKINHRCYYVCLACSQEGRRRLSTLSGLELISAHDLQDRDRFDLALQRIPDHPAESKLQADVEELLKRYANNLKLEPYMKNNQCSVFGYGQLGLTFGIQHSVPDATLPIYWAEGCDTWKPLKKRI